VVWCFIPLRRPLGLVIIFVIRFDVINTGYIVYFTICHFVKLDPATYKDMHSVLALKLSVTQGPRSGAP
jgi:hypothetical protein